jgi:hypothetical protein
MRSELAKTRHAAARSPPGPTGRRDEPLGPRHGAQTRDTPGLRPEVSSFEKQIHSAGCSHPKGFTLVSTIVLITSLPNIARTANSVTLAGGTATVQQHGGFGLFALIVAAVFLVMALRHLRRALLPIAELFRMVTAASLVVMLVLAAFVLIVMSAVLRL